jgi:glycosyltransferase involved in cell wall biosynthesis
LDLSSIIVNWHSADYVLACIWSIRQQTSAVSWEVIVVDNASFDGCGKRLAREDPGVVFVQSQWNLGFARANNLGGGSAQQTRGDFSNVMVRDSVGRFLRKYRGGFYRVALSGAAAIRLALLVVLFPAWLVRHRVGGWGAACRKCFAIFRWGLGMARWIRQYDRVESAVAWPGGGGVKTCAGSAEN